MSFAVVDGVPANPACGGVLVVGSPSVEAVKRLSSVSTRSRVLRRERAFRAGQLPADDEPLDRDLALVVLTDEDELSMDVAVLAGSSDHGEPEGLVGVPADPVGCGPRVRVLMPTTFADDEYVFDSLRAGASGFLLKDGPPEDLLTAVRIVARGDALMDPVVTRSLISAFVNSVPARQRPNRAVASLTTRERTTLQLLAMGLSNAEIADRLVISEATVKTHVGHVLAKLDLRDRVQAVIFAYESGLTGSSDHA